MRVSYDVIVTKNDQGGYDVACPDLMPHATWSAADMPSAAGLGAYAVAFSVQRRVEQDAPLPVATSHAADNASSVINVGVDVALPEGKLPGYIPIDEAARRLGITPGRTRQLARTGQISSIKYGNIWLMSAASVDDRLHQDVKPGRPHKAPDADPAAA
jgi:excisionase family DNA binding protein